MGKSPNTSLSFRYNANNEELEELDCEDDPPTPADVSPSMQGENTSPKKGDKTPSILDKYFKSMRTADKLISEKEKDEKPVESKGGDETRNPPKEVTSSPVKDYLKNLGKKSVSESADLKDVGGNETWKIFHDFKFKIAQAVEDMKTRSLEETKEKEKSVPRDNSISDSEENSILKDSDQSVGDTDNQVSSLNSSIQNLSEMTQPLTAKATDNELSLPYEKNQSEASDDTQKNIVQSEMTHLLKENQNESVTVEVESGIEALEDNIDGFSDASNIHHDYPKLGAAEKSPASTKFIPSMPTHFSNTPSQINYPKNYDKKNDDKETTPFFTLTLYFLTFLVFINYILFPEYSQWNGFLSGIWVFYFITNCKNWILANYFGDSWETNKQSFFQFNRNSAVPVTYTIPSVKEHRPIKKYQGWINHYSFPEYDPLTYTINKTTTAYMKLEGCNLRLSYTTTKIPKRALWDEKIEKVEFYQHRLYNLTGARVILLPKGLVKRRQWSKKYPICVILNENEKIQVIEKENIATEKRMSDADKKKEQHSQHEVESAETNTSPEKKKKFVWRRKDKSSTPPPSSPAPHTESEVGREGLRHRLVRKKHKDKRSDSVISTVEPNLDTQGQTEKAQNEEQPFHDAEADLATKSNTSTKDDGEDELDDTELNKIKEFLEQTELDAPTADGTSEGEWSVHVKHSIDNHSRLFLFTRTGRDKHEWFRRLSIAIADAAPKSTETSPAAEDKSVSEGPQEKESIEMALYKVSDKDNVAFAKKDNARKATILSDGGIEGPSFGSCEETFWPFLLRIIETHEMANSTKTEVGVMCQLEPSPRKNIKSRKKAKEQKSQNTSACECRMLPSEVTWMNTVIARIIYDLIHNQDILVRMQARIQRKLATMKLPSFMSPLVVTELSLAGACPLVERVCPPAWDERGLWLDADLRYDGGAYITILTQINLLKLKEKNVPLEDQLVVTAPHENLTENEPSVTSVCFNEFSIRRRKPAVYDSDVEDSAESSDDDDSPPLPDARDTVPHHSDYSLTTSESTAPGSSKKKFLRMVDKIATNKYFQQVTDYKYVKRAMEGLSNTDIKLQLEVQGLEGRLTFNLPPPPHDRVWFGFRSNPQLVLKARPAVGARTLRFAQISNWIEQKLSKEFEKILVLPNMEDLIIDVLTPTPVDLE